MIPTHNTTISNALVQKHGFTRVAFADPLKEVSAIMLTAFLSYMNDKTLRRPDWWEVTPDMVNKMKGDPAIRKLLQLVGTELGRDWYGPDTIWIDLFTKQLQNMQAQGEPIRVVIDDCRFPNEAQILKNLGFTVFRLYRDETARQESIRQSLIKQNPELAKDAVRLDEALETMAQHPSEREVENIHADFKIYAENIAELSNIADQLVYGLTTAHSYV